MLAAFFTAGYGKGLQAPVKEAPPQAQQQVKIAKIRFATGPMGEGEEYMPGVGPSGSWPGIVVVPDSWGLTDVIRSQARSLASHGYLVVAVDLYDGRTPSSSREAEEWMNLLPQQDAVSKLQGAVSFLQGWMANPERVGVVAWGSGGALALRLAASENNLKAVVVNYGPLSQDYSLLERITSPILVNAGALDTNTSSEQIASFTRAVKLPASRKDIKIYSAAGHNFEDAQNNRAYRPTDAIDADKRTVAFLAKWLKGS